MKLSSVLTALLISMSLAEVPACKKDKKNADDKAGEAAPADKPADPPAADPAAAGGEAKADPAAATGTEAKAEPAAAGDPTEVKKDEGGEKKEGEKGW